MTLMSHNHTVDVRNIQNSNTKNILTMSKDDESNNREQTL